MDGVVEDRSMLEERAALKLPIPFLHEIIRHRGEEALMHSDALLGLALRGSDTRHGGQMLHVMELAERNLLLLLRRNVRITVLFVDSGRVLWTRPFERLARRVLHDHIKSRLGQWVRVIEARTLQDKSLNQELMLLDPGWIVLRDEAQCERPIDKSYWLSAAGTVAAIWKLPVVYCDNWEFRGNDVYAFSYGAVAGAMLVEPEPRPQPEPSTKLLPAPSSADEARKKALESVRNNDARAAISSALKACDEWPLEYRCMPLEDDAKSSAVVREAIDQYCEALFSLGHWSEMIDCVDGRMVHFFFAGNSEPDLSIVAARTKGDFSLDLPKGVDSETPFREDYHYHSGRTLNFSQQRKSVAKNKAKVKVNDVNYSDAVSKKDYAQLKARKQTRAAVAAKKNMDKAEKGSARVHSALARSMHGPNVKEHTIEKKSVPASAKARKSHAGGSGGGNGGGGKGGKGSGAGKKKPNPQKQRMLEDKNRRIIESARDDMQKVFDKHNGRALLDKICSMSWPQEVTLDALKRVCSEEKEGHRIQSMALLELLIRRHQDGSFLQAAKDGAKALGFLQLEAWLSDERSGSNSEWIAYCLENLGERLPRPVGESDERVRDFRPDDWQQEMLTCVDEHRSALVVAPTSSGKTFVQYYAMEQVLKESDDGVVVYIAPTKSLCNQVYAGIDARYRKNYPNRGSLCLAGLFTRDERKNVEKCQILVTVPQCFDILVLSPTLEAQEWLSRVRWVILDEIQSINDANGLVWERIIQTSNAPLLALSATIGDPEGFRQWIQKCRQEPVTLIHYRERWSDLRMFAVSKTDATLTRIHPLGLVEWQELKERGIPATCEFESHDACELFKSMRSVDADSVLDLAPENRFKGQALVSRREAKLWAKELMQVLVLWSRAEDPSRCKMVLEKFRLHDEDVLGQLDAKEEADTVLRVAEKLLSDGPVLAFCFYRSLCERMVGRCVEELEQRHSEHDKKKSEKKGSQKSTKSKKECSGCKGTGLGRDKLPCENCGGNPSGEVVEMDDFHLFSFRSKVNIGQSKRSAIIDDVMRKLRWESDHVLVRGLKRGVACHHGGLPHRYRVAVELLFRTGDLRLLFATGTLAQGIHAPARSVLIIRDTTFLNATSVRQIMGRAGRRGYDDLGNCVFLEIPRPRLRHLLMVSLPLIRGGFGLSCSVALRFQMMRNWAVIGDSDSAKVQQIKKSSRVEEVLNRYLTQPLLTSNKLPQSASFLPIYYDFSLQLLRDLGIMNDRGEAIWLAAVVSHLSWMDPFNLVLTYFFRHGIFQAVEGDKEELLLMFASLLQPIALHPRLETEWKPDSSKLVAHTPQLVRDGLRDFNQRVIDLFIHFAERDPASQERKLPLSGVAVGGASSDVSVASAISVFARTSGISSLATIDDVVLYARHDLCCDHSSLPIVPVLERFNAFVIDFYCMEHPNTDHISYDNQIKDAWQELDSFALNLRVVAVALRKLEEEKEPELDGNIWRMIIEMKHDEPTSVASAPKSTLLQTLQILSDEMKSRFDRTKK